MYICAARHTFFKGQSMKKLVAVTLVALVMAMGTSMNAQSPSGQFGVGVIVGELSGAQIQYAISPAVHVGTALGLELRDGNTNLGFSPYVKFIFAGSKELKPFLLGSFQILSLAGEGSTRTALNFGGGAEYFITPNFGVWGGIVVLNLPLSPSGSKVGFGILSPAAGLEWFL